MPVNNDLYNQAADGWWNENHFLHVLKTGLNPARLGYFLQILQKNRPQLSGLTVLDVGSGGGILSEEFARLGCSITGIDLSLPSCRTAQSHAASENLNIDYLNGSAEALPFGSASFDVIICCDVLEHVDNPGRVFSEAARLLKPGGLFLFDTINRTIQSFIETILVAQEIPFTRFFAPGTHAWQQFIRPEEVVNWLLQNNLRPQELTGLRPGISALGTLGLIFQLKIGKLSFAEFGRRLKFAHGGALTGSYIGYAECKTFTDH